jgi:TetR/AcrR family acrAB operon transcriptional repressor
VDPEPLSPPTSASKRRSARAERRRHRILDAAAHCFGLNGFTKTTVEEIASNAGVSKGLVYAYFESKDDLLDAVLDRTLQDWIDVAGQEMERNAEDTTEALAIMHRASLDYARRNPVLRWMLQADSRVLLAGHRDLIERAVGNWRQGLVDLLRQGVESGELRSDLDVQGTVNVIQVLHLGFIDRLFVPDPIDVSDDAVVDATIELMRRGVAGGPRSDREIEP